MPPSLALTRSHATTTSFRSRRSQKKSGRNHPSKRMKFQTVLHNLVPVFFAPPRTLNFQMHEALLKRLGLWDFAHLELDKCTSNDLLAELIVTYNQAKHYSCVNGKRVIISRAKLASAMKMPVKKEKPSPESNDTPLSLESIAFLEEFVCNWILLHDDIWIMPPDVVEATKLVREGQPLMVDWAGLMWLMVENEILQGKDLVRCHYAQHLMYLMKPQFESFFHNVGSGGDPVAEQKDEGGEVVEEITAIQTRENGKEDDNEENRMSDEGEVDGKVEAEREGDDVNVETNEADGRGKKNTSKEDKNDQPANQCRLMDPQSMEFTFTHKENKDFLGEIPANFEDDMMRNHDLSICLPIWEEHQHEENYLRRCGVDGFDLVQSKESDGEETNEMEAGENKMTEKWPAQEYGSIVSTDGLEHISSMFPADIPVGVAKDNNNYPSKPIFKTQPLSRADISIGLGGERHKRSRTDCDMENNLVYDYSDDTCFEQIQLWLHRWKSTSQLKYQELRETGFDRKYLETEIHQRDTLILKICRERSEELQNKQAEVCRLERELHDMTYLVKCYRDALHGCRAQFHEYIRQYPHPVEPLYSDVDGGGGLVLTAVEVERMEMEKKEEEMMKMSLEKKLMEIEKEWCDKMNGHLHNLELLQLSLEERGREFSDIKEKFFGRRKAIKQQACSGLA